jgi:ATP-dependent RNA helicase SUPV3L1/SUV3
MAKGLAFRLVEGLGVLPRALVASDVKNLEQEKRGLLRKHGVRFGQFTLFQPMMLKPAPTRFRLVLLSLSDGLDEFPSSPPPGLVTIPSEESASEDYYTRAGFRNCGERAIRIDMLERLADQVRAEDTRGGFEAKADMLSITGLTLEQFAKLMEGLGYKAERGEREKQRPERPEAEEKPTEATVTAEAEATETPAPEEQVSQEPEAPDNQSVEPSETETTDTAEPGDSEPEIEVFYTFTWVRTQRQQQQRRGNGEDRQNQKRPRKGKKPKGDRSKGPQGAKSFSARPPKKEKAIDPDNPFAALAALKNKG